jgi:hypothetical protein
MIEGMDEHIQGLEAEAAAAAAAGSEEAEPSVAESHLRKGWVKVLAYVLVGVAFGRWVGWSAVDSVYFAVVTATTVGYGDFSLIDLSPTCRVFGCFYMFAGVIVMGDLLGSAAEAIITESADKFRTEEEVDKFILESEEVRQRRYFITKFRAVASLLTTVVAGAFFYSYNEGLPFDISFYLQVQTVTTVGYGDITLEAESSRLFSILYIPFSVYMVTYVIGQFAQVNLDRSADKKRAQLLTTKVTPDLIRRMDNDGDRSGDVSEAEYLVWMLVEEGLVNRCDCARHMRHFNDLDASNDKIISVQDIIVKLEREHKVAERERKLHQQAQPPPKRRRSFVARKLGPKQKSGGREQPGRVLTTPSEVMTLSTATRVSMI